jgi:hypothetical protein
MINSLPVPLCGWQNNPQESEQLQTGLNSSHIFRTLRGESGGREEVEGLVPFLGFQGGEYKGITYWISGISACEYL